MADYTPLNLADGQTFKAEHVAHMEAGVTAAEQRADDLDAANRSDWAAADSQILTDAKGYTDGKVFLRPAVASGVDFDTITDPGQYPVTMGDHPNQPFPVGGYLTVESNGSTRRLQRFTTNESTPRYAERVTALSGWNAWRIPRDAAVNTANAYTDDQVRSPQAVGPHEHGLRLSEMRRRVGDVHVKAKAAVSLVMDHGLNTFDASVRPLLEARNLPVTLALNSQWEDPNDPRYGTNSNVTAAMVKSWVDAGLVEPANHGRTHTSYATDAENTAEIVDGRTELETMLGAPVDSWVQPGPFDADGFNAGDSPEKYWTTHAGREILRAHPVVTGTPPGDPYYPLDGQPVVGMKGGWIDGGTAGVESAISTAIDNGTGYLVRFHPQYLDTTKADGTPYLTTAELEAFLDHLVALRDAGDIEVLHLRQLAVAEKTETYDSGWRIMPDFTGSAADSTRPGEWRLRRVEDRVTMQMVAVGVAGDALGFLGPNALPAGFTMADRVARMFEGASQHSTGVVSTVGPSHKILVANNDVVWRGTVDPNNGTVSSATPSDYRTLIHCEAEWTTNDDPPATLPGTAG